MKILFIITTLRLKGIYKYLRLLLLRVIVSFYKNQPLQVVNGLCNVCGKDSRFIQRKGQTIHNTYECLACGAMARYRALALVLVNSLSGNIDIEPMVSVENLSRADNYCGYSTSFKGPLNRHLGKCTKLVMSEYLSGTNPGNTLLGIRHETLTELTFENDIFDFIITTEVLEHVDEPWVAFREIHRTLKPGGFHVFTVPYYPQQQTVMRAKVHDGSIVHLLPPEYHHDPLRLEGALVFTDFGNDLIDRLTTSGFETTLITIHDERLGIFGTQVFVSRKADTIQSGQDKIRT